MAEDTDNRGSAADAVGSTPKISLKSSAAARIKKPPFGQVAPTWPQTRTDTAEAEMVSDHADVAAIAQVPTFSWRDSHPFIVAGVAISAIWLLVFAGYITFTISWRELFMLLPDQFGGFIGMLTMPLAFLWLLIAYLDRGRQLAREGAALRLHLAQLTFPSDHAATRVAEITESLRAQAQLLTEASDNAARQILKLQSGFVRDTEKLATSTGILEAGVASAANAVAGQVDKLKTMIDTSSDVNLKIEDALRRQQEFVRTSSSKTLADVNAMGQSLLTHVNNLSASTERARGMSAAIAQQMMDQEKALAKAGETAKSYAEDMSKAVSANAERVEDAARKAATTVADISDSLVGKATSLETLFDKQRNELAAAGSRIEDQSTKVNTRLGQQTSALDQVMERVLSRVKIVEEALAIQSKELNAASDGAVNKLRVVESMLKKQTDGVSEAASRVENRLAASGDEFALRSKVVSLASR